MKRWNCFYVLFSLLIVRPAMAQLPQTMSYQGRLTDAAGIVVPNGSYSLTFKLYDVSSAGAALWTESHPSVQVTNGVFSVTLGNVTAFGLPFDRQYWLGLSVSGGAELLPRTQLTSSPYSMKALGVSGSSNVFPSSGNVGIGTTNPFIALQVDNGNIRINGAADGKQRLFLGSTGGANDGYTGVYKDSVSLKLAVFKSAGGGGFGSNSLDALTIRESSGNVGIGTTSPAQRLDVHSTDAYCMTRVVSNDGSKGQMTAYNGGQLLLNSYTTGGFSPGSILICPGDVIDSRSVLITSTGNVGIGTTGPAQKLDVAGTAQMTGFKLPTGAASGYVLTSDVAGVGTWQAASGGGVGGSGTLNYVPKFTGATALGNSVIYENAGSVGIGTTSPGFNFDVVYTLPSNINPMAAFRSTGSGSAAAIRFANPSSNSFNMGMTAANDFAIAYNNNISLASDLIRITSTGYVGIGITSPTYRLQLLTTASVAGTGYAYSWSSASSRRWKENINPITDALGKVQHLRGVTYDWKANEKHDIGLIAEEVGEVIPEVVSYEKNGKDATSVDYSRLVAVLIEAVKELNTKNKELSSRNEKLDARLAELESVVKSLAAARSGDADKSVGQLEQNSNEK